MIATKEEPRTVLLLRKYPLLLLVFVVVVPFLVYAAIGFLGRL